MPVTVADWQMKLVAAEAKRIADQTIKGITSFEPECPGLDRLSGMESVVQYLVGDGDLLQVVGDEWTRVHAHRKSFIGKD